MQRDRRQGPQPQQQQKGTFLSRITNPLFNSPGEPLGNTAYSPSSNPFAPRPNTRTPPGAVAAAKLTTSADGEFFDLELTPGVESKRQSRLSTEALSGAPEQSGAEDWLSSPEVDLGAIQASWDSVLQQENVLPAANWGSLHQAASKLSNLGTPASGNPSKARAWLREHASTPGKAAAPAGAEEGDGWQIKAGQTSSGSKPAAAAKEQSPAASGASDATPRPGTRTGSATGVSPLAVPSPAYEYPRSFALEDITNAPGLPSASGSFKSWLREEDSDASLGSASTAPTEQAAEAAEEQQAEGAAEAEVDKGFASPISVADSPAVPAPAPSASRPAATRPIEVVVALLALAAIAGLAALLPMPGGTPLLGSAKFAGAYSSLAIYPHGLALPVLPTTLADWARLLPTTPSTPQPAAQRPAGGRSSFIASKPIKKNPPLPASWAKPAPAREQVLGTSFLSRSAQAPAPATFPQPARDSAAAAPKAAAASAPPAIKKAPAPSKPADAPAQSLFKPAPAKPAAAPTPAPAKPAPAAAVPTPAAPAQPAAVPSRLAALMARVEEWAERSQLVQQVQLALGQVPYLGGPLPTGSNKALAALGAGSLAAGALVTLALAARCAAGPTAYDEAAGEDEDGEPIEAEVEALAAVGRPGTKSALHSHMKMQRAPTTTPAVGGRARRRQSNIAVIEYQADDAPSVAPHKPEPRTAPRTGPKARRAAGLGLYDTVVAETPGTVRRSRRLQ